MGDVQWSAGVAPYEYQQSRRFAANAVARGILLQDPVFPALGIDGVHLLDRRVLTAQFSVPTR